MKHHTVWMASTLALLAPAPASAQAGFGPEDVVADALSNPSVEATLEAHLALAKADSEASRTVPLPKVALGVDQLFGPPGLGMLQVSLQLEQEFDLSDRRARLAGALAHREDAARSGAESRRRAIRLAVLTAFYAVRREQERVGILDRWIERLEAGLAIVEARRERGDASEYATRRVGRELEIARAQRALADSELAHAWSELEPWTSWGERPALSGGLTPTGAETQGDDLPELERLAHIDRALGAERDAHGAPFWRAWTVGAGYTNLSMGQQMGHGFLVNLEVPLALWNTDAPLIARIDAQRAELASEADYHRRLHTRAARAARERLATTLTALEDTSSAAEDDALTRMAELAFRADEATLTDLLDAYSSEAQLRLARLDLSWEARLAALDRERHLRTGSPLRHTTTSYSRSRRSPASARPRAPTARPPRPPATATNTARADTTTQATTITPTTRTTEATTTAPRTRSSRGGASRRSSTWSSRRSWWGASRSSRRT